MRLLLVEDDQPLGKGIGTALRQAGFTTDWVRDGDAALQALGTDRFDAVVLDLGLPRLSGIEVLKRMRARHDETPVLILTARDTVAERVQGLDTGADDYLVKPFDVDELSARLRALIRRRGGRASPGIEHRGVVLDPAARTVRYNGEPVDLPAREFDLLHLLLQQAGTVLSKSRLEEALYGWDMQTESNTVEVYIHHLRRKLGHDLIQTVRGVGYMVLK